MGNVQAPCGIALFGGNRTYQNAISDIGSPLNYSARFVSNGLEAAIADREFNVRSIAKASMGTNSVVDIPTATPNKLSCLLTPQGSPSMLKVDLIVLNRRQEDVSETQFDCSEVVREIVAPIDGTKSQLQQPGAQVLKEVETTSLYKFIS